MSVRRCQREVSSAEFIEWLGLWRLRHIESVERERGVAYVPGSGEDQEADL